jgi:hypothetical protein
VRDEFGLGQNVQQRVDIWRSSDASFEDFKFYNWEAISLRLEMQDLGLLNSLSDEKEPSIAQISSNCLQIPSIKKSQTCKSLQGYFLLH